MKPSKFENDPVACSITSRGDRRRISALLDRLNTWRLLAIDPASILSPDCFVILDDDILIEITVSTGEYIVSHMRSIVTLLVSFAFMGLFSLLSRGARLQQSRLE